MSISFSGISFSSTCQRCLKNHLDLIESMKIPMKSSQAIYINFQQLSSDQNLGYSLYIGNEILPSFYRNCHKPL